MIACAVSSFLGVVDLLTKPKSLEGAKIFYSAEKKSNLPLASSQDSHHSAKINFFMPPMNTKSTHAQIKEAMLDPTYDMHHMTSILDNDCNYTK